MLYNTTREALLQAGCDKTALTCDALYTAGFKPLQAFTAQQAIDALHDLGTPAKIILAGLKHAIFSPRGRRNRVFTMPEPNEARRIVGANILKIRDILPSQAFKSCKAYRLALHGALIARRPGFYLRGVLSRRLGVCRQTTLNYDRELGHDVEPQHDYQPLTRNDYQALPIKKYKGGRRHRWLAKIDESGFIIQHAPMLKAIARKWLTEGFKVVIIEQKANHYRPAPQKEYAGGAYAEFINT